MLKIELKKQIVIKHSNENIKKFEVNHILYCDHIQSKGKNTLLLYCGYSFKDKNIIDARDEHMKYQFIKSDNCGHPDYYLNIKDYNYIINEGFIK